MRCPVCGFSFPVTIIFNPAKSSVMAAKRKAVAAEKGSEMDSTKTQDDRSERACRRAILVSIILTVNIDRRD